MLRVRWWLEYAAARLLLGLLAILPRTMAIVFSSYLSRAALAFLPKLRRVALRNLELAYPDWSLGERTRIYTRSIENLGRILGEFSHLRTITPEELRERVEFRIAPEKIERYRSARAEGRGVIFVTPHLGNWEILVLATGALMEPTTYLARPLDNPLLEKWTAEIRTRFGNRPMSKRDALMEGLQILERGGSLGLLADVNTLQRDGVFVPFFGRDACTTRAVAMLALRTNALIVPICGVWDERAGSYAVLAGDFLEVSRTGKRKQDIQETTARFTVEVEKFIRAYPEQWIWVHRRWKTRPRGEPNLYADI